MVTFSSSVVIFCCTPVMSPVCCWYRAALHAALLAWERKPHQSLLDVAGFSFMCNIIRLGRCGGGCSKRTWDGFIWVHVKLVSRYCPMCLVTREELSLSKSKSYDCQTIPVIVFFCNYHTMYTVTVTGGFFLGTL